MPSSMAFSQLPRRSSRAPILRDESNAHFEDDTDSMLMDASLAALRSPKRPTASASSSKASKELAVSSDADLSAQLAAMDDSQLERMAWEAQAQQERLEARRRKDAGMARAGSSREEEAPLERLRRRIDSIGPDSRRSTVIGAASTSSAMPLASTSPIRQPPPVPVLSASALSPVSAPMPKLTAAPQSRIPRKSVRWSAAAPNEPTQSEAPAPPTPSPKKRRLALAPADVAAPVRSSRALAAPPPSAETTPRKAFTSVEAPKSALRQGKVSTKEADGPRPSVRFTAVPDASPLNDTGVRHTKEAVDTPQAPKQSNETIALPDTVLPSSDTTTQPSDNATQSSSPTRAVMQRKASASSAAPHTSSGLTLPSAFHSHVPAQRRSKRTSLPPSMTPVLAVPARAPPPKKPAAAATRKSVAPSNAKRGARPSDVQRAAVRARAKARQSLAPPVPAGYRKTSTGALMPISAPHAAPLATTARRQKLDLKKEVAALAASVVETRGVEEPHGAAKNATGEVPAWIRARKAQLVKDEERRLMEHIEKAREAELHKGQKREVREGAKPRVASGASTQAPAPSAVEVRLAERAARVRKRKAQDELLAAAVAEAREERERAEERAYREERKRTVVRANPVPDFIRKGRREEGGK